MNTVKKENYNEDYKDLISIIIPTYNCMDVIGNSLNYILCKNTDLIKEIIIIDDGSSDDTVEKIRLYESKYNKVKIIEQEHSNAGHARNVGLDAATGKYVWFIDSDDLIDINSFAIIQKELENQIKLYGNTPDIIKFGYQRYDIKNKKNIGMDPHEKRIYLDSKTAEGERYTIESYPKILTSISYVWNNLYKLEFIKKNKINFSELIVSNDVKFKILSDVLSENFIFIKKVLYTKVVNRTGYQLRNLNGSERLNFLIALDDIRKELLERNIYDDVIRRYFALYASLQLCSIQNFIRSEYRINIIDKLLELINDLSDKEKRFVIGNLIKINNKYNDLDFINNIRICDFVSYEIKPKVSVIITTYNLEKYIRQTINSIVNQDIPSNNYEIIVVDDCSKDNTREILKDFSELYLNLKLIFPDKNIGFGAAVNLGIKSAQGEYLMFLDGDDFVERNFVSKAYNDIVVNDTDVHIFDYFIFIEAKKKSINSHDQKQLIEIMKKGSLMKKNDFKNKILALNSVPWRKIYKRQFIIDNNLFFPEERKLYSDNSYHWLTSINTDNISASDDILYHHRKGREGQSIIGRGGKFLDFNYQFSNILSYLKEYNCFDDYKLAYCRFIVDQSLNVMPKLGSTNLQLKFLHLNSTLYQMFNLTDLKKARKMYPCTLRHFKMQKMIIQNKYSKIVLVEKLIKTMKIVRLLYKKFVSR